MPLCVPSGRSSSRRSSSKSSFCTNQTLKALKGLSSVVQAVREPGNRSRPRKDKSLLPGLYHRRCLACHKYNTYGFALGFGITDVRNVVGHSLPKRSSGRLAKRIPGDKLADLRRNNTLFTKVVWKLLEILSNWEKVDANHDQKLTLELSAYSPSDFMHKLQLDAVDQDNYPYRAGTSAQKDYIARYNKDSGRLNINRYCSRLHDHNLLQRFGDDGLDFAKRPISRLDFDPFRVKFKPGQSQSHLPEVRMVSSFLLRRQHYRSLSNNALRRLVKESFTSLRELRFERWRLADAISQETEDWQLGLTLVSPLGAGGILGSKAPSPLETLSLFEDFSRYMHGTRQVNDPRPSRLRLLAWVANYAVNMKHFSVSFLSDAKDCLDLSGHAFPKLQSIALTSQHWLEPTEKNTEKLLLLAARAAERMPNLQIMEIWTCRDGHAAIFRYEATGTSESSASRLTWRCSWDSPQKPIVWSNVIAAWRHVASTVAGRELRFTQDPLPRDPYQYRTYGGMLHQLKLRNWILDPTSVMQVRMRTAAEKEPEVEAWRPSVPDSYWSQRYISGGEQENISFMAE